MLSRLLRGILRPPLPSPPLAQPAPPRPRAPPPRRGGRWLEPPSLRLEHSPALHPLRLRGPPARTLPGFWLLPDFHRSRRPLIPARRVSGRPLRRPPPLTPYPDLGDEPHRSLSQARAVEGGLAPARGPGGSGAPCRSGPRPTPGVCSVRSRSERRARGKQVPAARGAHESQRAEAVSDGRGGGGGVNGERPARLGATEVSGRAGLGFLQAPPSPLVLWRSRPPPPFTGCKGDSRGGGEAKVVSSTAAFQSPRPAPQPRPAALCGSSGWSSKGGTWLGWALSPTARLESLWRSFPHGSQAAHPASGPLIPCP